MCEPNRTLIIPKGTLDGNVTNVVMIPNALEDSNRSLVVRAPDYHNTSLQLLNRGFMEPKPERKARSLHGSPLCRESSFCNKNFEMPASPNITPIDQLQASAPCSPASDHYESDFDDPPAASTFQEYLDDEYYFDMYDSSADTFVGGESGNLSGSIFDRLLAGEHNRRSGMEEEQQEAAHDSLQPPPFMIESPISSHHSSARSSGYEGSSDPYQMSNYTPLSQSISVPSASYMWPPAPNCGPCHPGSGGNFELCPGTCPVKRGIPFRDPNKSGDYYPEPPIVTVTPPPPFPEGYGYRLIPGQPAPPAYLNDTPPMAAAPAVNTTRPIPNAMNLTRPRSPILDRTRPMTAELNRTRPTTANLNRTRPMAADLNRTRPMAADLNRTRPMAADLNRTRPMAVDLNRTRPMAGDLNRTRPMASEPRMLNTTGPAVSQSGSRINLNVTVDIRPGTAVPATGSRSRIPVATNRYTPMVQRATVVPATTGCRRQPQQIGGGQSIPRRVQQQPNQQRLPRQQQRPARQGARGPCNPCSARPRWR